MPKKYEVIVVCEVGCPVLNDKEAIRQALDGKMQGEVLVDILIGCSEEVAAVSLERSFLLTENSDIQSFKEAIITIKGVAEIRDGHIWSMDDDSSEITFFDNKGE